MAPSVPSRCHPLLSTPDFSPFPKPSRRGSSIETVAGNTQQPSTEATKVAQERLNGSKPNRRSAFKKEVTDNTQQPSTEVTKVAQERLKGALSHSSAPVTVPLQPRSEDTPRAQENLHEIETSSSAPVTNAAEVNPITIVAQENLNRDHEPSSAAVTHDPVHSDSDSELSDSWVVVKSGKKDDKKNPLFRNH